MKRGANIEQARVNRVAGQSFLSGAMWKSATILCKLSSEHVQTFFTLFQAWFENHGIFCLGQPVLLNCLVTYTRLAKYQRSLTIFSSWYWPLIVRLENPYLLYVVCGIYFHQKCKKYISCYALVETERLRTATHLFQNSVTTKYLSLNWTINITKTWRVLNSIWHYTTEILNYCRILKIIHY